jgi:hypothetical protein
MPLRSFRGLLFLIAFGVVLTSLDYVQTATPRTSEALPVKVTCVGLKPGASGEVILLSLTDTLLSAAEHRLDAETTVVDAQPSWILFLRFELSPQALADLERLQIDIGTTTFSFDRERIEREWVEVKDKPNDNRVFDVSSAVRARRSFFRRFDQIINWPGDMCLLPPILTIIGCAMAVVLISLQLRKPKWADRLLRLADFTTTPALAAGKQDERAGYGWFLAGSAFMLVSLTLLEVAQPWNFSQDDNFSQFLPVILQGGSCVNDGIFPTWNPYQLLGAPTASMGVYSLTYPPTYLCYFTARYLLGDARLTIEVFCILHLYAGYVATFWCARMTGLRPALAVLASLSFALSGYQLIAGRSWYYMTPVAVYAPLLFGALMQLVQGRPTWRWVLGTGLAVGLFFHSGNAQMWAYTMLFLGVAGLLLMASGQLTLRQTQLAIPALLLGLAVAAPLLVPQAAATAGLKRVGGSGVGIVGGLPCLLLPYPLGSAGHPEKWGADQALMCHIYYSGTVFLGAGMFASLAVAMSLLVFRWKRSELRRLLSANIWVACGLVAFLLALGSRGLLWTWLCRLPVFDKFNHPFKFLPFMTLFLVLAGGVWLERSIPKGRSGRSATGIGAAVVAVLLLYHCWNAQGSFYAFKEKPYPPLPAPLAATLKEGEPARIWSIAPERSPARDFVSSLQLNFPTVYGVLAVDGYDPLVAATPEFVRARERLVETPVEACKAFGVRRIVVHRLAKAPEYGPTVIFAYVERLARDIQRALPKVERAGRLVLATPEVSVFELPDVAPLAFAAAVPATALPLRVTCAGAYVDISSLPEGGDVVVNFLKRPETVAAVDGQPLAAAADEWGRVVVRVPAGGQRLEVRLAPPWGKGFLAAILLAGVAGGLFFAQTRWNSPRTTSAVESPKVAKDPDS